MKLTPADKLCKFFFLSVLWTLIVMAVLACVAGACEEPQIAAKVIATFVVFVVLAKGAYAWMMET